jgi:hypothetical protein
VGILPRVDNFPPLQIMVKKISKMMHNLTDAQLALVSRGFCTVAQKQHSFGQEANLRDRVNPIQNPLFLQCCRLPAAATAVLTHQLQQIIAEPDRCDQDQQLYVAAGQHRYYSHAAYISRSIGYVVNTAQLDTLSATFCVMFEMYISLEEIKGLIAGKTS